MIEARSPRGRYNVNKVSIWQPKDSDKIYVRMNTESNDEASSIVIVGDTQEEMSDLFREIAGTIANSKAGMLKEIKF